LDLLNGLDKAATPDRLALAVRSERAHWIGETGNRQQALNLYPQLLPDRERTLGPDHPDTQLVRRNQEIIRLRVARTDPTVRKELPVALQDLPVMDE